MLRKLQWPGSDFRIWLHADPLAAVVPGFFRTQACRVRGRGQKVPGLLLHPVAQPNAEVAKTKISSPAVMEVLRTGSISWPWLQLKGCSPYCEIFMLVCDPPE